MNEHTFEKSFKITIKEEKSQDIVLEVGLFEFPNDRKKSLPLIILLHGWNNKRSELEYLITALLKNHFKVLAYSYRGHGKSSGKRMLKSIYADFNKVVDYAIKEIPNIDINNINLIGQSFGAGISLTEGFKNNRIKHIFALNPFFNPKSTMKSNKNFLIKLYLRLTEFKLNQEDIKYLAPEFILKTKPENATRLFLIMTKKDSYIPYSEKQKLIERLKLPDENIKIFSKGNHSFKGMQDKVTKQIITWLKKFYPKT